MKGAYWFHADRAGDILGLDYRNGLHTPVQEFGNFPIITYYGDWTLRQLHASRAIRPFLHDPSGYNFSETPAETGAGYYALRTTPLQANLTWDQQLSVPPKDDWMLCPTVIAVVGTLLILLDAHESFLEGACGSCAEDMGNGGHRPTLTIEQSVLYVRTTMNACYDEKTFPFVRRIECKKIG